jgi:hypothetical protein
LDEEFNVKSKEAKVNFSKSIVNDLRFFKQSQWYSKIKRMTSHSIEEETVIDFVFYLKIRF